MIGATRALCCGAVLFVGVHRAAAQTAPLLTVRVHVADSSGAPIVGAEISLMRGVADVQARGTTDAAGNDALTIARHGHEALVVVRKIGYQRLDRFFDDSVATVTLTVVLARVVRTLAPVNVSATADVTRKSYFIDAEEIEKSPLVVENAFDIVTKLKPDMIWGRSGKPDRIAQHGSSSGARVSRTPVGAANAAIFRATRFGYCPPVENVWVNGIRVREVSIDPVALARRSGDGLYIGQMISTVLASIKPEHIAELEYHPCSDLGPDKPYGSNNAIFVTLKDGIAFDPGHGSVVSTAFAQRNPSSEVVFRNRILGVFDDVTGVPVPGVNVTDVATGTVAQTTSTGTVTLSFLPPGESQIRVHKDGYTAVTMSVLLTAKDTAGITIVLTPVKTSPPSP